LLVTPSPPETVPLDILGAGGVGSALSPEGRREIRWRSYIKPNKYYTR